MILFFYGEDSYRLAKQVKKLKEKFISASLGDTNLSILDSKTLTYEEFIRQILAMPFLNKSRLVIIENILSEGKKEIQEKIGEALTPKGSPSGKKVPSSTVLLFTENKPDKRLSLYKKLLKVDKVEEIKPLDEERLRRWIKNETESRGGSIDSESIDKLVEYVGNDLWRLSNEIDKLTTYDRQITTSTIELLVPAQVQKDIFKMVDAIGNQNLKSALKEVDSLQKAGDNELYILSMIVYQYRNLLIIKDLQEKTQTSSYYQIAKESGLHPFVVQKTIAQTRNFTFVELKKAYATLLDFDIKIKTGKIEGKTALSIILAKFCM